MAQNGYGKDGMIALFKHLKSATSSQLGVPEFLSTHPGLDTRVGTIQMMKNVHPAKVNKNVELDRIWKEIKLAD